MKTNDIKGILTGTQMSGSFLTLPEKFDTSPVENIAAYSCEQQIEGGSKNMLRLMGISDIQSMENITDSFDALVIQSLYQGFTG